VLVLLACQPVNKNSLKKIISENPDIITDAIEKNPDKFIATLNKAVKKAQEVESKKREESEKQKLEEAYKNPLKPEIRSDELFRGNKDAPITLVEYSDFQCPFCSRALNTVLELLDKYKGKIRLVYKHLPLSFHPQAELASQYYEAARLQSEEKAIKFHDELYKNQAKIRNGEKYLKEVGKKLKLDVAKLAKDAKSSKVQKRIDEDKEEAAKFGFQGTPGFLLNGIPVKGAYPTSHFVQIVDELKKRGMLSL
jgi:protein-disulfide isomerase